ncbi:copper resistance CopC family protein [Phytoactinopolyspora mesophila]|uniref:Copper resistance protein CopC n=1 Tax=Phytoactinopolyspora mesophila TaxID=2650750 RepID=A0A7K3MCJ0_9ACTN|nr:copper resistance CopC family protein [Phytoactinopolyspora mesophila]NDL60692.1 copper resistance protein CopC [Phytoactinopolyspora mesophila]
MITSCRTRARPHSARTTRARIGAAVAGALAGSVLIAAPQASAHNALIDTSPDDGSTVSTQPGTVELVYDQFVQDQFTQVAVLDADENPYHAGEPEVDHNTVTQAVEDLPDGEYTVSYRVISADGHPVSGTFTFTMAAGDSDEAVAPANNDDDTAVDEEAGADEAEPETTGGISPLVSVVVIVAVVTAVAAYFIRHRRGRRETADPARNGGAPDSQRD